MKRIIMPSAEIKIRLKQISNNIRKLRESRNYSQEYMAGKLSISQNTYSKLELGYTAITIERLLSIANILNIEIMRLIYPVDIINADNGQNQ